MRPALTPAGYGYRSIQRGIEAEERTKKEAKAKAQAMANALATIGKFVIRKKVGAENAIYGSVTAENVVATIEQQVRAAHSAPFTAISVAAGAGTAIGVCSAKLHVRENSAHYVTVCQPQHTAGNGVLYLELCFEAVLAAFRAPTPLSALN